MASPEAGPVERHSTWMGKVREGTATATGTALLFGSGVIVQLGGIMGAGEALIKDHDVEKALAGVGITALAYLVNRLVEHYSGHFSEYLAKYHEKEMQGRVKSSARMTIWELIKDDPKKAESFIGELTQALEDALPSEVQEKRNREKWHRYEDEWRGRRVREDAQKSMAEK